MELVVVRPFLVVIAASSCCAAVKVAIVRGNR